MRAAQMFQFVKFIFAGERDPFASYFPNLIAEKKKLEKNDEQDSQSQ